MASLLIIGGSGFFGKSFLDGYKRGLLAPWGIDLVLIMARKADKLKQTNPELLDDSVVLINSDITNCSELPAADYVIHAAASTDAVNYLSRPEIEKKNIQAGTYNYCELAKKFHHNSRILYCSSGAVYGQQPLSLECIYEEYDSGSLEDMALVKRDYAAAKRDGEKAIQILGSQGGLVSIARCFAFIGQYLPRDQHFAIGNFIQDGLGGRSINIKATIPVYRSYMYSDDLVHWLMTICNSANSECPIYNVGSDHAVAIADLAGLIAKQFAVEVNNPNVSEEHCDRYIPCIDKARRELGLNLSIDLNAAISKTIENIRLAQLGV